MDAIAADMSAMLSVAAALGAAFPAQARGVAKGPARKLAIARIDNRRAMKMRTSTDHV